MYCLDAGILQEKTIPEMLAHWLGSSQNVGSSNSPRNKDQELGCETRRRKITAELMRGIKPKLSISKPPIFGCTVFMRKRDRDVSKLEPKALEGKFMGYTAGDNGYLVYVANTRNGSSRCDHQGVRSGLNPWQHRDARTTRWGVTATGDLAPRWWSSRRWQ